MNRRFKPTFERPFDNEVKFKDYNKDEDGSIIVYSDDDSGRFGGGLIISGPQPPDDNTKEGLNAPISIYGYNKYKKGF